MPFKSEKQKRYFGAILGGKAKKKGPSKETARKFFKEEYRGLARPKKK